MQRREFLKMGATLAAVTVLPVGCSQGSPGPKPSTVPLLSEVPDIVGETAVHVEWTELLKIPQAVDAKAVPAGTGGRETQLEVNYRLAPNANQLYLPAAPALVGASPPERLRFWIQGDGTGNILEASYFYAPAAAWRLLAAIPLNFTGWRHLEIPADNAVYLYYPSISDVVRLTFRASGKANQPAGGTIHFRPFEWVGPALVNRPMPTQYSDLPAEIYDTWGGPGEEQLSRAAAVGVNLHQVPVGGIGPGSAQADIAYAAKAVEWVKRADMLCCLSLEMPDTAPAWLRDNQSLLCRDEQGEISNGILSPWNPHAQALWERHIVAALGKLKDAGRLKFVDAIRLCPGDQGEVAFQWSNVWAFDSWAISAYRAYLSRLYGGKVASLNADWGTRHASFERILPSASWFPDRQHWVFLDFYRLGMLRQCVRMADAVRKVFRPQYWLWLLHSLPSYPMRFYAARYPLFYAENLRRLGLADIAHIPGLNWQTPQDIHYAESLGIRTICEIDVVPTMPRLKWTFSQAEKFGFNGVFIGIAEQLSDNKTLTPIGRLCRNLIVRRQRRLGLSFPPGA